MSKTSLPTESSIAPNNGKDEHAAPAFRVEDRRFSSLSREPGVESAPPEHRFPSYVEELRARVTTAEKKLAEKVQWMEEEVNQVRDRLAREQDRKIEAEKAKLVETFLEVADNFDRALAAPNADAISVLEGLKLIRSSFVSKLEQLGVEVIELVGQPFDPNVSEAVAMIEVQAAEQDHVVVEVLENGYRMGDRLLRPAKVRVGRFVET